MDNFVVCHETYGGESMTTYLKQKGNENLVAISLSKRWVSLRQTAMAVFLPAGFPESVSEDYIIYQLWDTIQAFASSITGSLATQAILKGVGVGDENATPLAATITWLLKDGTGMLGRIIFAWMEGSMLDCDSKKWRLFADVLNDFAIFLDLLAPYFRTYFTPLVCVTGLLKSLVGVAGGATRAALTQHQARRNNLADVAAKDGSQETLVNLAALICSLIMIPLVAEHQILIWTFFFIFTGIHLFANYSAVASLVMATANQSRYHTLVQYYLKHGHILSLRDCNKKEPFIKGVQRPLEVHLGCPLNTIISRFDTFQSLQKLYIDSRYLLRVNLDKGLVGVVYHPGCTALDELESCFQVELICFAISHPDQVNHHLPEEISQLIHSIYLGDSHSITVASRLVTLALFPQFLVQLKQEGWQVTHTLLGPDEWRTEWEMQSLQEFKVQ